MTLFQHVFAVDLPARAGRRSRDFRARKPSHRRITRSSSRSADDRAPDGSRSHPARPRSRSFNSKNVLGMEPNAAGVQRPEYASQGTCHKCAAPLGRGSRAHKRCGRCGVTYHTTDCGQRYSVLDNPTAYNLEDCPKVNKLLRIPSSPLPASSTRSRPLI